MLAVAGPLFLSCPLLRAIPMRQIRSHFIDPDLPQTVHVTSKCSRSLRLLVPGDAPASEGGPVEHADLRKELVMQRLEVLEGATCIAVCGFALMDNHMHLILRNLAELAKTWSAEEVMRRWLTLHPLRNWRSEPVEISEEAFAELVADEQLVAKRRRQLADVSEFMKDLKQRVAQEVNKLEGVGGRFWDGAFKCRVIEDEQQLVATMVYVDLNPFAAGACATPEQGRYTSLCGRLGRDEPGDAEVQPAEPAEPADRGAGGADQADGPRPLPLRRRRSCAAWLRPLDESAEEQRRRGERPLADGAAVAAGREGCVAPRLSLRVYLALIDAVARRLREGKRRLHAATRGIFERVGLDAEAVVGRVLALAAAEAAGGRHPRTAG